VAERKPAKKGTQKPARSSTAVKKRYEGFTDEEKSAMRAPDRALGERLHKIIKASAPALTPRLWYGMPAYTKDDKIVCHFQDAQKFKSRYATLGFGDAANLDEGAMWPVAFALKELTAAEGARIGALVKKAVS